MSLLFVAFLGVAGLVLVVRSLAVKRHLSLESQAKAYLALQLMANGMPERDAIAHANEAWNNTFNGG